MIVKKIKKVIKSSEFTSDLKEYSNYAMKIKLERFIAFSFAKRFSKSYDYETILEENDIDLIVRKDNENYKIELKYHFDFDILKIYNEMNKYKNLENIAKSITSKEKGLNWKVIPNILKDMQPKRFNKKTKKDSPDLFIWIIAKRDISKVTEDKFNSICMAKQEIEYIEYLNSNKVKDYNEEEVLKAFSNNLMEFSIKTNKTNYLYESIKIKLDAILFPIEYRFNIFYKNNLE
ncbi:MAG TPA: hypothetical protein PK079_26245 [Leptospiraceae bacterium]|nr:hypothetical protein [Leptospiraceae bacterium]HMZ67487.1 hypothetical protein [Leptospiraceae bacterium]HNC59800.1 hypothetical protein [Leptospiraceae bacterium]HNE11629.1 hypothetical protein [Leptospiraceae bacterium]HNE56691.1 hypothetical protein [Leptospiraceae bacterium]